MKLENVKVGETYMLAVGKNAVAVTVKGVDEKGKITVMTGGGKTITVADAARLTVHHTNAPQAAKGAKTKAAAPKATKAASGRDVGQKGAPQAKEKRVGLVDAAILVMHEAGNKADERKGHRGGHHSPRARGRATARRPTRPSTRRSCGKSRRRAPTPGSRRLSEANSR